jgi:predicted Zn finger-like uncharacterized protein
MVSNSLTDRALGFPGSRRALVDSPMLIVCPSCATAYEVKSASLPPEGRQVRCLRCRTVWHAEPDNNDRVLAAAAAAPDEDLAEAAGAATVAVANAVAPRSERTKSSLSADESTYDERPADAGSAAALVEQEIAPESTSAPEQSADEPDETAEVEAPPLAPDELDHGQPPIDIGPDPAAAGEPKRTEDVETAAARRLRRSAARRAARWPLSRLQTAILALVLIDTIVVAWRHDIVRALPQTASFYALLGLPVNVRGLSFDDVVTTTEQHEGVQILVVEGNIVNTVRRVIDVPRLKFVVRNAARQEIYSWTAVPSRASLSPGEVVAFRTRLASPPPEAHDVILRFVTRRDVVAGGR